MPISNEELIMRVRLSPEIWNSSHRYHMNRAILRRFWNGLAEEYGENESRLRKRWKHYKDQFRKEYKKVIDKALPDDSVAWQYYELLSFLKEDIENKEKQTTKQQSDGDESENEKLLVERMKFRPGPGRFKRVISNPKIDTILKKVKETKAIVEDRLTDLNMVNRNDPDFMYLLSLLPTIKQLSEIQKLQFKGKINDWLLQEITSMNTLRRSPDNYVCVTNIKTETEAD